MSSPTFDDFVKSIPPLHCKLLKSELRPLDPVKSFSNKSGIYILYEANTAVYVGRTRKLKNRLRAHIAKSHNSASFALKRTRAKHNEIHSASYSRKLSRKEIVDHDVFGITFLEQIEDIKGMQVKFLEVTCPVKQYLLELFSTMELNLDLSGFNTH